MIFKDYSSSVHDTNLKTVLQTYLRFAIGLTRI